MLQGQVGELTAKHKPFLEVLGLTQIKTHLPYISRVPGRQRQTEVPFLVPGSPR
jgi:hypothetical protein